MEPVGECFEECYISYRAIARRSGLHPTTVSRIMAGATHTPRAETLARISQALKEWSAEGEARMKLAEV